MKKLTDKQEKFSQLVVSLGNQSEAYRQAYNVSPNTSNEVISVKASELMKNGIVSVRVEEIREETKDTHGISRAFIINGLLEIVDDADYTFNLGKDNELSKEDRAVFFRIMQQTKNTDKLKALDQLCKMLGLNEPDKIEVKDSSHKTNWG